MVSTRLRTDSDFQFNDNGKGRVLHPKLNFTSECEYSRGWLKVFKKRSGVHKLKNTAEKAADYLTAIIFVDDLAEYISTENFTN